MTTYQGSDTPGQGPEFVSAAASSALPTVASQAPNASQATSAEQFMRLLQLVGSGVGYSGPMTTMQPTLNQPQLPVQYQAPGAPQIAQGPFGSSGERKRADSQAMFNNLASFSKSVTDYLHQKKVQQFSSTIERVMSAQSGVIEAQNALQQAQAALQQNPRDLAALSAMQKAQDDLNHNKEILGALGSDPKTAKMLEKAFSVKLLGDDKGKASPEYQALQMALKNKDKEATKKAGLAMMDKFIATQPMRQQVSPQYAAYAQMVKDKTLADAAQQLTFNQELNKTFTEAREKGYDRESKERIASALVDAKDRATRASILNTVYKEQGRMGVADVMTRAEIQRVQIQAGATLGSAQWRAAGEILAAQERVKGVAAQSKIVENLNKEVSRIDDAIKMKQKELKDLGEGDLVHMPGTYKKIDKIKGDINQLQKDQKRVLEQMKQFNIGGFSGGTTDESGTGTTEEDTSPSNFDKWFERELQNLLGSEDSGGA